MKKLNLKDVHYKNINDFPNDFDVKDIHENIMENNMKEENEGVLADFYSKEMEKDLKQNVYNIQSKHDLYESLNDEGNPYLISNNIKVNEVPQQTSYKNNQELLNKLNYIISMFEEQKEIKTKQKNEEVVLYCFLGIFVIYVLDSFVYIGKYSR